MRINISAVELCQIAKSAYEAGDKDTGDRYYHAMLCAMLDFCAQGRADEALSCESCIYRVLVKANETEESCERYFSSWREPMYQMGLKYREPFEGEEIGFVLQTAFTLGHVEALYHTLKQSGRKHPVYVLGNWNNEVVSRFRELGVPLRLCMVDHPAKLTFSKRILWLRDRMRDDRIGTAVWVSTPTLLSFALGVGIAGKQVYWAHRHHPNFPADVLIGYGSGTAEHHGRKWLLCKPPMIDWKLPKPLPKAHELTYGTIAREEKLESPGFLDAVVRILKATGGLWEYTGKQDSVPVRERLQREGVRGRYIGWVEPRSYVGRFHCFLETFPVGGLVSIYALAQGVPVVALSSDHNPLSYTSFPVCISEDQYVDRAINPYLDAGCLEQIKAEQKTEAERFFSYL